MKKNLIIGRFSSYGVPSISLNSNRIYFFYLIEGELTLSGINKHIKPNELLKLENFDDITINPTTENVDLIIFSISISEDKSDRVPVKKINLSDENMINKWIIGYGNQPIKIPDLSIAHVNFINEKEFQQILQPIEVYHKHEFGYEYYLVLNGSTDIKLENKIIQVNKFEMIEIPSTRCHMQRPSIFPLRELNFRYPSIDGDKELC